MFNLESQILRLATCYTEALQEKRNNFFVYEPIFVLKRGKFAHVPGASASHLGLTQQKRKLPDIVKCADAPEFKCTDICTLRVFFCGYDYGFFAIYTTRYFYHALTVLVLLAFGSSIYDDWSTPPPVQQAPSVAARALHLMYKLFICDFGFSHFFYRGVVFML